VSRRKRWRLAQSGLERVARIAAALTESAGERGQPDKLHTLALLRMAHLQRALPKSKLHGIAVEVAREFHAARKPNISLESLISELERGFRRDRVTWLKFASTAPMPDVPALIADASGSKSADEFRARARIVEALPTALDLYDTLVRHAKRRGDEDLRLVRRLGRERAETLLDQALAREKAGEGTLGHYLARGHTRMPRDFFDLLEPDLARFKEDKHEL
jgi:hypothetical protein